MDKPLYDFLVSVVQIDDNPSYSAWHPVKKVLWVTAQVSGALIRYLDVLASDSTVDDAEVTAALTAIYDRYFVPIKLSNNPFIESFIEGQVRNQIPQLTLLMAQYVQSQKRNE